MTQVAKKMTLADLTREVRKLIPDGVFSVNVSIWSSRDYPEYDIWDAGESTIHRGNSPEEALTKMRVAKGLHPAYQLDEVIVE